jgi:hypothetical protein
MRVTVGFKTCLALISNIRVSFSSAVTAESSACRINGCGHV